MNDPRGPRQESVRRSREAILDAAAASFLEHGVQAPVRDVAARAGVGLGTVYRHFPTRADLVNAVYRHQVQECTSLARSLLDEGGSPAVALQLWVNAFVDFLVTKHGLSDAMRSEDPGYAGLHALVLHELVPACARLLSAGQEAGELDPDLTALVLLRAIGNLCILGPAYTRQDAQAMVTHLLAGCRTSPSEALEA